MTGTGRTASRARGQNFLRRRGDARGADWPSFVASATWFIATLRAQSRNVACMRFWGAPGDGPEVLRVASDYEAATKRRLPPPDFGPVRGEP